MHTSSNMSSRKSVAGFLAGLLLAFGGAYVFSQAAAGASTDPDVEASVESPVEPSPGETVSFGVTATDDRDVTVSKESGRGTLDCMYPAPGTASCDFEWTPDSQDTGSHEVVFKATGDLGFTDRDSVTINVDSPPSIGHTADSDTVEVSAGERVSFSVIASDDSGSVSISKDGPGDLTCPEQGRLDEECDYEWTPESDQTGSHKIEFTAKDDAGQTDQTSVTIEVTRGTSIWHDADEPVEPSPGEPVRFEVSARTQTGQVSVSKLSGPGHLDCDQPPHASFKSCDFQWTPGQDDAGESKEVVFEATGDEGQTAQTPVIIRVTDPPPEISHAVGDGVEVSPGETASFDVVASDNGSVSVAQVRGVVH